MFIFFFCRNKATYLLINITVGCCTSALINLLFKYFNREQNEVLFFYGNQSISGSKKCIQNNCKCSECNLHKIIGWLNGAKKTLDICMYMLSHELLTKAVIDAHKRGVCVRLITNEDNVKTTWRMGIMGIAKKVKNQQYPNKLMHHKFIIIDTKKCILGSLNWTYSATRNNWENIFITNECKLVDPYVQEFQRLWRQFK